MEVGVETWRVFKHGEGSILFPDEQLPRQLWKIQRVGFKFFAHPPLPFPLHFLLLNFTAILNARILMEHYEK